MKYFWGAITLLIFCCLSLVQLAYGITDIAVSYANEKLEKIISDFAQRRGVNIIYPQSPDAVERFKAQTITYHPQSARFVTEEEAWNIILFFTQLAGFSIVQKSPQLYAIVATGSHAEGESHWREPLPLYIDIPPAQLPQNSEPVRYVYYFTDLSGTVDGKDNEQITQMIATLASSGAPAPYFLSKPNGVLMVDRADRIAWIVHVLRSLEETVGKKYRSTVAVLQLNFLDTVDVAGTLDLLKKAAGIDGHSGAAGKEATKGGIAFQEVKITPFPPRNQLIFTGPEESINVMLEFVQNELDVPISQGRSVLHTYDLEYLSAQECAKALNDILAAGDGGAQAEEEGDQGILGRLKRVVVAPLASEYNPTDVALPDWRVLSTPKGFELEKAGILQSQSFQEGNRLLIAAAETEWQELKKVIEQLDRREPHVFLEAAVVEFTYDKTRLIAANTTRFDVLTSNIVPPAFVLGPDPTSITTDLLASIAPQSIPRVLQIGSTLIALGDPEVSPVFSLIQFIDQFLSSRILIQPHVLATNNKKAVITENLIRRARGDVQTGNSGFFVIPIEEVKSTLRLYFLPQISPDGNTVTLSVGFGLVDFIGTTLNRRNRMIKTTVTLKNNQLLAIGGIVRTNTALTEFARPLLGHIPILRIFFTGASEIITKRSLLIVVRPRIVMPKEQKERLAQITVDQTLERLETMQMPLVNPRQPFLGSFFSDPGYADDLVYEYFDQSTLPEEEKILLLETKRKRPTRKRDTLSEQLKAKLANETSPISTY